MVQASIEAMAGRLGLLEAIMERITTRVAG